jgi:hypothetical protein
LDEPWVWWLAVAIILLVVVWLERRAKGGCACKEAAPAPACPAVGGTV